MRTVGIDYLSVGGYRSDGAKVHKILLQAGIWIIEGLDLSPVTVTGHRSPARDDLPAGQTARQRRGACPGHPQAPRRPRFRPGRFRRSGTMRLLVVGGGPGGLAAAVQGRELGADVTLLEAGQVGGTNLNHGPTPVRTWPGPPGWPGTGPHGSAPAWRAPGRSPTSTRFWLIEAGPRLVPGADISISTALGQAFETKGIKVITGAKVQALERSGEQVSTRRSFLTAAQKRSSGPNLERRRPLPLP